jgi:hypothetical protein
MPSLAPRRLVLKAAAMLPMAAGGCGPAARGPAVPVAQTTHASVLGLSNERFFPFHDNAALQQEMVAAIDRQRRVLGLRNYADLPELQLLAVSGGGENGAFGAGLLCAWSALERARPSTG